ncbi:hypothetical protein OJAV_G00005080 [Oryzias javanicus]|uniref:Transmembrane protein 154 n=1 Tax=Oryzias javanicus TaxID=123683 RepID=A0A437DM48_ORYJA|nr:hypothetical protein OJAV_G00005080 [Oryzias javanicus]
MSGSFTVKMRGAWVNTPLLLLLLLLACLTRTAISQDDDSEEPLETASPDNTEQSDSNTAMPGDVQDITEKTVDQETEDPINAEHPLGYPEDPDYLPGGTSTSYISISPGPSSSSTTEGSADEPSSQEVPDPQSVSSSSSPEDPENSNLMLILIPVVVVTLIGVTVCGFFIIRQLKQNTTRRESVKEDPFLEESSTEKVPMPMFEEDVPSVLELEMEDFDQWIKKDC